MAREATIKIKATDEFSTVLAKYNQAMGTADNNNRKVAASNKDAEGSFRGLQTAIGGAVAAIGIQQVIQFAEGFNQLGVEVHANRVIFNQLAGEIGGAETVLQNLRRTTGGVVSDLDLMAGASQLLRLNIVDNNEDLGELTSMIQKLKSPTESTTDAIQNFALMLSNESLLRLDSFGISSANVKRRMDELGQSFREATMAEMAGAVERLGEAGNVAETGLAKLQIRLENFWNQAAENFAIGVEATISGVQAMADYFSGNADWQIAQQEQNAAFVEAGTNAAEEFIGGYAAAIDPLMQEQLRTFAERYAGILETVGGADRLANRDQQVLDLAREVFQMGQLSPESDLFRQFDFLANMVEGHRELLRVEQERTAENERQFALAQSELMVRQREADEFSGWIREQQQAAAFDPALEAWQRLNGIQHGATGRIGNQSLFSASDAAEAQRLLNQYEAFMEAAQDNPGLLTEEQLALLKEGASQVREMANDIERGAEAFANMSLTEMLGTGSGGALGEMTDQLTRAMEAAGRTADEIAEMQRLADLASGRETNLSLGFDSFLNNTAAGMGAEQQLQMMQNLAASMPLLRMNNISDQMFTNDFWMERLAGYGGNGKMAMNFDPESLMETMGMKQGFYTSGGKGGLDQEGLWSKVAEDTGTAADNMALMSDGADSTAQYMTEVSDLGDLFAQAVAAAGETLQKIGSQVTALRFDVQGIPPWLEGILNNGQEAFFSAVETTVQSNGGRTPGNARRGQAGRVVERD